MMITGYTISDKPQDMDINIIHDFISNSYWAKGIPKQTMQQAINNSLCFGVFSTQANNQQQVGFARMITDKTTFAYLADVFIIEAHRGKGLSKWLMQTIAEHPDLQGLRRMMLATSDAHDLYRQFGFTDLNQPDIIMENWQPHVYS